MQIKKWKTFLKVYKKQTQNYFDFNGKKYYVNATMSCDVKNVLYVIRCLGCNEYYIG